MDILHLKECRIIWWIEWKQSFYGSDNLLNLGTKEGVLDEDLLEQGINIEAFPLASKFVEIFQPTAQKPLC